MAGRSFFVEKNKNFIRGFLRVISREITFWYFIGVDKQKREKGCTSAGIQGHVYHEREKR